MCKYCTIKQNELLKIATGAAIINRHSRIYIVRKDSKYYLYSINTLCQPNTIDMTEISYCPLCGRHLTDNGLRLYGYRGPAYKFGNYLENVSLHTFAVSLKKAKSNFEYQIKNRLGLTADTKISIDENKIYVEHSEER